MVERFEEGKWYKPTKPPYPHPQSIDPNAVVWNDMRPRKCTTKKGSMAVFNGIRGWDGTPATGFHYSSVKHCFVECAPPSNKMLLIKKEILGGKQG